jgi:hypothetical protein
MKVWHVVVAIGLLYWLAPKRWQRMTGLAAILLVLIWFVPAGCAAG